jgi:hypothetical protein
MNTHTVGGSRHSRIAQINSTEAIHNPAEVKKLEELSEVSQDVLFSCNTVFPFTLFPKTLIIDKTKVKLILTSFFLTKNIVSYSYDSLLNVTVSHTPFFATVIFQTKIPLSETVEISYLKRRDAIEAEKIISGLLIAKERGIQLTQIPTDDLTTLSQNVGDVAIA